MCRRSKDTHTRPGLTLVNATFWGGLDRVVWVVAHGHLAMVLDFGFSDLTFQQAMLNHRQRPTWSDNHVIQHSNVHPSQQIPQLVRQA